MNKEMFTSAKLRWCSAELHNPENVALKPITLYLDGMDSRINYNSTYEIDLFKFRRKSLHSWKLKRAGARTQVFMDINKFYWLISDSVKAGTYNDGSHFEKFAPDKYMEEIDCLQADGGYTQHIAQVLEANHERKAI